MELLVVLIALSAIGAACYCFFRIQEYRYQKFIEEHSVALKNLQAINERYEFKPILRFILEYSYDNENYYSTVSTRDYLIYQLVYLKKDVQSAMLDTANNAFAFSNYSNEIKNCCIAGIYDTDTVLPNTNKLLAIENRLINTKKQNPITRFSVTVKLYLTNINGAEYGTKQDIFFPDEITEIIEKLNDRINGFYRDSAIWNAICRVERAKVSNKMRFAVYARDGYRCRKCGKAAENLEVDHIFPVSKGGKSEFNNLQTLCRMCNLIKSDIVECGAVNPLSEYQGVHETCAQCGAPLVRKNGKYGAFLGCSNYPKCRYTRQIR